MNLTQGDTNFIGLGWGLGLSSFLRVPKWQCSAKLRNVTKQDVSSLLPQITGFFIPYLLWQISYECITFSLKTTLKYQNLLCTVHNSPGFACTLSLSLHYMHIFSSCLQGEPLEKESWETLSNILTYNCNLPHFSLSYITYRPVKKMLWLLSEPWLVLKVHCFLF